MSPLTRRALLQTSAGAAAATALPLAAADAAPAASATGVLDVAPPRLNAGTGNTPLTPAVLRALRTPNVPVNDPSFVELFDRVTRKTAEALGTQADVLLLPGEAIIALEAVFRSVTRPGLKALNVISGVYGADYTTWLQAYGAEVVEVRVPFDQSVDPAAVEAALDAHPDVELLTVVHVDTPSGTANPLEAIARAAKARGVVTLTDAASTVGGMPLDADAWGVDIAVGAAHKCLGSPVGFGITTISDAGWALIDANTAPPQPFSILSLATWRATREAGRVPSTVPPTTTYGLDAALDGLLRRGPGRFYAQTARAAQAFRAGAQAAGIGLWAAPGAIPADTNTTLVLPGDVTVAAGLEHLRRRHGVAAAGSAFTDPRPAQTVRVAHMGPVQTAPAFVLALFGAVARGWRELGADVDVRAGLRAARAVL